MTTWILRVPRAIPAPYGDFGVFLSVSERLLAGDRLYADVWEVAAGGMVATLWARGEFAP